MDKTCIKTTTYSGYIDQSEFIVRYLFIRNRIANSLTREELAFLLGKTPYFIIDYEELSGTTKLSLPELDLLCNILKRNSYTSLILDKTFEKKDISHEKRKVRVTQKEYPLKFVYQIIHPWTDRGSNEPLEFEEPKYDTSGFEANSKEIINASLINLFQQGFFEAMRKPSEIYERIWAINKYQSTAWSVVFLKDLVYMLIRNNELTVKQINGQFNYQGRNRSKEMCS